MKNRYHHLNSFQTRALIAVHGKQLHDTPHRIEEHINELVDLAKHFQSNEDTWRNEWMQEQLANRQLAEEFKRLTEPQEEKEKKHNGKTLQH